MTAVYDIFSCQSSSADDILTSLSAYEDLPFYPLTTPGMPPPGPDFVALAQALGDPEPVFDGKIAGAPMTSCGPILTQLYRAALYDNHFVLPVTVKGRTVSTWFRVGHRWGETF